MSCPYFREGYIGVCVAFEKVAVPSIERLETYCFRERYSLCPNLSTYMPAAVKAKDSGDLWVKSRVR
jgi:hypothetical protein